MMKGNPVTEDSHSAANTGILDGIMGRANLTIQLGSSIMLPCVVRQLGKNTVRNRKIEVKTLDIISRAIRADEMVRHDHTLKHSKCNYLFLSISSIEKHY